MFDLINFHQQITDFIYYLDDTTANKFFKSLKKEDLDFVNSKENSKIDLTKLQFLLIPFLSEKEVSSLLKENLKVGLYLEDIDVAERLRKKLIFIDIEDRDETKGIFETALLANRESIIEKITLDSNKSLVSVNDWIKDYISFNQEEVSTLRKAQYFSNRLNKLSNDKKDILKKLFDIYDFLSFSSKTPEGFEDDLLLKDGEKLITTNNGVVVVLYDPDIQPKRKNEDSKPLITNNPLSQSSFDLSELEQALTIYPKDSLEHKAISQEISRIKRSEFKQAQKTDAKL